jgi:hypothetical protein
MEKKMSRVSLQNGGGPGSSISLAPETIRVRNALIEKFTGEPLDEMNHFMNTALAAEKNELRRIGILAARIFLLRTRVANLQDFNRDPSLTNIPEINVGELGLGGANMDAADDSDDDVTEIEDGWARLKMTAPGEVQGVRFLSGAIIDAKPEDAEKLIQSGKAVYVDENGSIIEFHEDDFDNQDEVGSASETEDSAEDANVGSDANDSDSAEADETTSSAMPDEQTAGAENDEQPAIAATDEAVSDDDAIAYAEQPVSSDNEITDNADDKT